MRLADHVDALKEFGFVLTKVIVCLVTSRWGARADMSVRGDEVRSFAAHR